MSLFIWKSFYCYWRTVSIASMSSRWVVEKSLACTQDSAWFICDWDSRDVAITCIKKKRKTCEWTKRWRTYSERLYISLYIMLFSTRNFVKSILILENISFCEEILCFHIREAYIWKQSNLLHWRLFRKICCWLKLNIIDIFL